MSYHALLLVTATVPKGGQEIGNAGMLRALPASDGLKHFRADPRGDREKQEVG